MCKPQFIPLACAVYLQARTEWLRDRMQKSEAGRVWSSRLVSPPPPLLPLLPPPPWPLTCARGIFLLVGRHLRRGDKHIALISSAIIYAGQGGTEPTEAGRRARLLLTYLRSSLNAPSLLISTVEIKLGVIAKFLASLPAALSPRKPLGSLRERAWRALTRSRRVIRNDTLICRRWKEAARRTCRHGLFFFVPQQPL